jgi:DNA polymerase III subunit gamma/tau
LKTLEEPPPHVKFLLATTDPQKLPVTVLSRCLQFNLKRMPVGQIAEHMKVLLEKEDVPFEPAGLRLVAQAADGSMRDGLSLLDQLIAFGGGKAGEEEARAMLGTISRDHVERLAELLAAMNVQELMQCARSLEEFAPDYAQVLDELAGLLVRVALKQTVSDFEGDDLYAPELLERLAKALAPEDIQLYYQTAIIGRRDLALAPDPRTGFEMTLLRMIAFRPANDAKAQAGASAAGSATGRGGAATHAVAQAGTHGGATAARAAAQAGVKGGSASRTGAQGGAGAADSIQREQSGNGSMGAVGPAEAASDNADGSWASILNQLDLLGAARQLASHCALVGRQGGLVRLALDPRVKFVRTPSQEEKLAQALSRYYGETVRIEFTTAAVDAETPAQAGQKASQQELATARQAFETDPGVQGLRERFGATLLPDTVRPLK